MNPSLRSIRETLANRFLVGLAFLGIPMVGINILRAASAGWRPEIAVSLVSLVIGITLALLRRRLPYGFKAAWVVFAMWSNGFIAVFQNGLLSTAILVMVLAPLLLLVFKGARAGLAGLAACVATYLLLAVRSTVGGARPSYDPVAFVSDPYAWATAILIFTFVAGAIVYAFSDYSGSLLASNDELRTAHLELEKSREGLRRA